MGKVHLELSSHINGYEADNEVQKRLLAGDYSASIWPKTVTTRSLKYHPEIVVSDSCDALYTNFETELSTAEKVAVRKFVPPSLPEELDDNVNLLAGDFLYWAELFNLYEEDWLQALKIIGGTTGYGIVARALVERTRNILDTALTIEEDEENPLEPVERMSRRALLLRSATCGVGIYAVGKSMPSFLSSQPTHSYDALYNVSDFIDIFRTKSDTLTWIDGRTALLVQKATEAADQHDATVSVVIGNGHHHRLGEFTKSKNERFQAIQKFVKLILDEVFIKPNVRNNPPVGLVDFFRLSIAGKRIFKIPPGEISGIEEIQYDTSDDLTEIFESSLRQYI